MADRTLSVIAIEVKKDWKNIYFAARPYLAAMSVMDRVSDKFGLDDGEGIVLYFLANAGTWRGETAKRIKAELNAMLKKR